MAMTTLTLQLDDKLVEKARLDAERQQTTLDELFARAVSVPSDAKIEVELAAAREKLIEARELSRANNEGMLTREERNYRPGKYITMLEEEESLRNKGNAFLEAVRESGLYYTGGPYTHEQMNER
jgi:hypothetical protein